jgi:transcriptional regulator with XRE-family HTH domain
LIVGAALRRYRQESGLALEDAAGILDCDRSKISRIETGHRGIRRKELRELLAEYGADKRATESLAMIAAPRAARGWWHARRGLLPEADIDLIVLEAAASEIQIYQAQQVPDLLQIEPYALATAHPGLSTYGSLAADCRAERQQLILEELRPSITAIIAETVLRPIGGDPELMQSQLAALATAQDQYLQLNIHVLPSGHLAHAAITGSFTILRYPAPDLAIVHLPALSGGTFLTSPHDLAIYTTAFGHLRAVARPLSREPGNTPGGPNAGATRRQPAEGGDTP